MTWHAYHNGKRIPYWLGVVLALDQFAVAGGGYRRNHQQPGWTQADEVRRQNSVLAAPCRGGH